MDNFDFRSVDFFLKVAETLNFTRAAQELYISQPALSKCIRQFEREIGVKLFDRTTKKVELTEGGRILYDTWSELRDKTHASLVEARRLNGTDIPRVRIGLLEFGGIVDVVTPHFETYAADHPELELTYEIFGFSELKRRMMDHEFDLIVTLSSEFSDDGHGFHINPLRELKLYIILSDKNHFYDREKLDFEELENETFCIFSDSYSDEARKSILRHCETVGFTPKKIRIFSSLKAMEMAIEHSDAITIGYDVFFSDNDNLKFFPIEDIMGRHELIFVWGGELSKATTEVMNYLENRLKEQGYAPSKSAGVFMK